MSRLAALPAPLRTVVVLLLAEAAALLAGGVYVGVAPLWQDPQSVAVAVIEALVIVATAAVLGVFARGLAALRRWARSPVVLIQLLALPVGVSLLQVGRTAYGTVVVVLAALVLLLLLGSPQARAPFE